MSEYETFPDVDPLPSTAETEKRWNRESLRVVGVFWILWVLANAAGWAVVVPSFGLYLLLSEIDIVSGTIGGAVGGVITRIPLIWLLQLPSARVDIASRR